MAATPSYTPQEVAAAFVDRYYFLLCESPGEIHKFYQDSSMVSRLGADGAMISFTTMEEIEKHVLSSLDCKEYDILFCDAQFTAAEGVFVVVVGCFTKKNDETRKFNQSFLLAPLESGKGYFVSNDILRFLDEQKTITTPADDVPTVAVASSTPDDATTDDLPKEIVLPKKSFLSVVNALNENNAPFKEPPVKKSVSKGSNLNRKSGLGEKKNVRNVGNIKGTSIFVGRLAMDTKPEELYEAFKSFGPIRPNGVQIRTDKLNRWYAFIEFESSNSAQSAIQASFIRIGNRNLNIEEKKHNEGNGQDNFNGGRKFTTRPAN
ncbi:hypothetical protein REPUB_Repub13aG0121300 [Reevesia pubescens]